MGGRDTATFTATVGDLALPGYTLSVPRMGSPSRPASLTAVELAELERVAMEMVR